MQIITKNRKNASFLPKNYLRLLLKRLSNTTETQPKTVDGNKETVLEIFKTISDLNPISMKSIFSAKLNARVRPNNILVKACKSVTFGDKSLATLGPKIWNALPQNIKADNSYVKFKEYIPTWFGTKCKCNLCSSNNS